MNNILITGFQKFGDYRENVTEVALRELSILNHHQIHSIIFPVRIFSEEATESGQKVIALARKLEAKAIISLGMSSAVQGLRIESCASNWVENKKYCLPGEHKKIIDQNLKPKEILSINLQRWNIANVFKSLDQEGLDYEEKISQNACNFCCNALMFRVIWAMKQTNLDIPYIFLHVPCTPRSVMGLPKGEKRKYLTSIYQVRKILDIFCSSYVS